MGFPDSDISNFWLDSSTGVNVPPLGPEKFQDFKNPEIPILDCYEGDAGDVFWEKFPKRELPGHPTTRVNIENFESRVLSVKDKMMGTEFSRAERVIQDLKYGASAYQISDLPPLKSYNAKSAFENGALLTDTMATWVKKGFVAGPFETPPMAGFRANPLAAIARNGKVRPILNMSGPVGRSFNDNVDRPKLERLHMGTAKQFGQALLNAGQDAVFFKIRFGGRLLVGACKSFGLQAAGFLLAGEILSRDPARIWRCSFAWKF